MSQNLHLGDLVLDKAIFQGGMGVGISLGSLAGHVAACGGMGLISTAQIGYKYEGFEKNPLKTNLFAMGEELKKAREIAKEKGKDTRYGIGFNIMVATKGYEFYVREAVLLGADIIVSGAGLPVDLPELVDKAMQERESRIIREERSGEQKSLRTKFAPIISSAKSASVILKLWDRKYGCTADAVVMEGPLAGGHLGFSIEELTEYGIGNGDMVFNQEKWDNEVGKVLEVLRVYEEKYQKKIPLILAGGIYTHEDYRHALSLGVSGVQVATRFVTTYECDAPSEYKEAYIKAKKEDIRITKSPVGLPGRAIDNIFLENIKKSRPEIKKCYNCLAKCDRNTIPYCITDALIKAATGDTPHALLFAGANAYKATHLETVSEVMEDLVFGKASQEDIYCI